MKEQPNKSNEIKDLQDDNVSENESEQIDDSKVLDNRLTDMPIPDFDVKWVKSKRGMKRHEPTPASTAYVINCIANNKEKFFIANIMGMSQTTHLKYYREAYEVGERLKKQKLISKLYDKAMSDDSKHDRLGMFYVERKYKEEFGLKQEIHHTGIDIGQQNNILMLPPIPMMLNPPEEDDTIEGEVIDNET